MKTMQTTTRALIGADRKARPRHKPRFDEPKDALIREPINGGLIQWPTHKEIMAVSKQLVSIGQMGLRSEASGDYFHSGDLAYQMQEIIRTTAELFRKGQRLRR